MPGTARRDRENFCDVAWRYLCRRETDAIESHEYTGTDYNKSHSFIHSFVRCLLMAYHAPGAILSARDETVSVYTKTDQK